MEQPHALQSDGWKFGKCCKEVIRTYGVQVGGAGNGNNYAEWRGDVGDNAFWNEEEGGEDEDEVKDGVEVEKSRQAKSVCMPSSWLMSLFKKASPGMRPRFSSQKIDANEPEKKMPLMATNASGRSANVDP